MEARPHPHGAAARRLLALLLAAAAACANIDDGTRLKTTVSPTTGNTGDPQLETTTTGGTGTTGGSGGTTAAATTGGYPPGYVPAGPPPVFAAARGISIMTADTNLCLELQSNFAVLLAVCDGSGGQRWELSQGAVRSLSGQVCLDVAGSIAADNQPLVATTCAAVNAANTQQWNYSQGMLLVSANDAAASATSTCVAVAGAAGQGASLVVHARMRTCQHFVFGYDGAQISLDSSAGTRCVDISKSAFTTTPKQITLASCAPGAATQLWTLSGAGEIRLAGSNTCIGLSGGQAYEGAPAVAQACSGGGSQSFTWFAGDSSFRPFGASSGGNPVLVGAYGTIDTNVWSITTQQPHGQAYTISK